MLDEMGATAYHEHLLRFAMHFSLVVCILGRDSMLQCLADTAQVLLATH